MSSYHCLLTRYSLAFVWIYTAITSLLLDKATGLEILSTGGITGLMAEVLLFSGAILDLIIGVWLLTNQSQKLCCDVQLATITIFTLLLTLIDANFWLHPFGPVTKNIPIMVLILIYRARFSSRKAEAD